MKVLNELRRICQLFWRWMSCNFHYSAVPSAILILLKYDNILGNLINITHRSCITSTHITSHTEQINKLVLSQISILIYQGLRKKEKKVIIFNTNKNLESP